MSPVDFSVVNVGTRGQPHPLAFRSVFTQTLAKASYLFVQTPSPRFKKSARKPLGLSGGNLSLGWRTESRSDLGMRACISGWKEGEIQTDLANPFYIRGDLRIKLIPINNQQALPERENLAFPKQQPSQIHILH